MNYLDNTFLVHSYSWQNFQFKILEIMAEVKEYCQLIETFIYLIIFQNKNLIFIAKIVTINKALFYLVLFSYITSFYHITRIESEYLFFFEYWTLFKPKNQQQDTKNKELKLNKLKFLVLDKINEISGQYSYLLNFLFYYYWFSFLSFFFWNDDNHILKHLQIKL